MKNWWRNRDFILILSVVCGLVGGAGVTFTTLPVACYLGALVLTALIALGFLGSGFVEPWEG
jgi:hypothetical protein